MLSNVNVEAWSTVGTMMLRENGAPCAAIYTNNPTPTSMQPTAAAAAAAAAAPPTTQQTDAPVEQTAEKVTTKDDRGDVMIRHFWERHRPCVFDTLGLSMLTHTRIATKHPRLFWGNTRERERNRKYKKACLNRRRDFTPICYTADGMAGREARNAERRLGYKLAEEWTRQPSHMIFYVRSRMSLALVRATSYLIRGSRERRHRIKPLIECGAGMSNWQTWDGN